MNPTRREVIATALALSGGVNPPLAEAKEPKFTLSTFDAEVTVPLGHPLMGGGITPAKKIDDPLLAHGFVLRGVGKPVVFVALDWCEIRNGAYELFREKIAKAVETEPVRVMLCALHQHDAPIVDVEAQQLLENTKRKARSATSRFWRRSCLVWLMPRRSA
ncbi:MAG: hypothetical protein L0241_09545 [Planctomycetia bacterium]|nr:hypothetical protein [Planctomycetia bacterium]